MHAVLGSLPSMAQLQKDDRNEMVNILKGKKCEKFEE
jgi:hypothetical protein